MQGKSILNIIGSQNQVKLNKGHQVLFSKSKFLIFSVIKCISDIMGGQKQVKVTKGHQVQFFRKCILGHLTPSWVACAVGKTKLLDPY